MVMDNAVWHRAKEVLDYFNKLKIEPIFIVLRASQLNAIELYFKVLKKKNKSQKRKIDFESMIKRRENQFLLIHAIGEVKQDFFSQ